MNEVIETTGEVVVQSFGAKALETAGNLASKVKSTNPVILTGAAVVAVGVAAFGGWKAIQRRKLNKSVVAEQSLKATLEKINKEAKEAAEASAAQ